MALQGTAFQALSPARKHFLSAMSKLHTCSARAEGLVRGTCALVPQGDKKEEYNESLRRCGAGLRGRGLDAGDGGLGRQTRAAAREMTLLVWQPMHARMFQRFDG